MRYDHMFYLAGDQKCIIDRQCDKLFVPRYDVMASPSGKNMRAVQW